MQEIYRWGDSEKAQSQLPICLSAWQEGRMESWHFTPIHATLVDQLSRIEDKKPEPQGTKLNLDDQAIFLDVYGGACHLQQADIEALQQEGIRVYPKDHDVAKLMLYQHYGYIADRESPIYLLNTSYGHDVLVLSIAAKTTVHKSLHLRFHTEKACAMQTMPRVLVVLEADSSLHLFEEYVASGGEEATLPVVEMVLGEGASCHHYKLQTMSDAAMHLALTGVLVAKNAHYKRVLCQTGAKLARDEVKVYGAGSHGDIEIAGMYIGQKQQHLDQTVLVHHQDEAINSRQIYRGILAENARGVFQGKIHVDQKAQQTDGYQINRTVTLADTAWMHAKPELEIYADDVKCSHGSIVGSLDREELYYLRSRGIAKKQAEKLLLQAHMAHVLSSIDCDYVQQQFADHIEGVLATLT